VLDLVSVFGFESLNPFLGSSSTGLISSSSNKLSNETIGDAGLISFLFDFLGPTFIPTGKVGGFRLDAIYI